MSASPLQRPAQATAAAGLVACVLAAATAWNDFLRAWLVAAIVWLAVPLGAMALLMMHNLTGGGWGEPLRRSLKAAVATLPLALAAFVPLVFDTRSLFAWTAPAEQLPEVVVNKQFYLNLPFFYARAALYVALWLWLAHGLNAWRREPLRPRGFSAGGLVLWTLTTTFFAFDWLMSLEPTWYSDIFGLLWATGSVILAISVLLLSEAPATRPADTARTARLTDLANIWLTFLVAWLFMIFSQYLIIWSTDLPHEIEWYLHRHRGGWQWVSAVVLLFYFLVPFGALLSTPLKRRPSLLFALALMVFLAHCLETARLVLPAFKAPLTASIALTPVTVIALGALWLLLYRRARERGTDDRSDATMATEADRA